MIISYLGGKLTHRFRLVCRQKVSKYFQQITSVMWDHAKDVSKILTNYIKIRSDIKPQTNLVFCTLTLNRLTYFNASKIFLQHANDQKLDTNYKGCNWLRLS